MLNIGSYEMKTNEKVEQLWSRGYKIAGVQVELTGLIMPAANGVSWLAQVLMVIPGNQDVGIVSAIKDTRDKAADWVMEQDSVEEN
ncbi:hypothetical protein LCGC14_2711670 [marine sediment metagenome]|uniref:Uncharacterized protein n=1 Tax=marine sediment metagenome TaxID=412755 RepID=A0A0F9C4H1_9ZZZZ